jgi:hypothetical protein
VHGLLESEEAMKPETLADVWALLQRWRREYEAPARPEIEDALDAILARHVEQLTETEEQAAIRAALTNIVAACCKIPMARPTPMGLECPHCEARACEGCKSDCWWPTIEAAIDDGREALRLAKETDNAD